MRAHADKYAIGTSTRHFQRFRSTGSNPDRHLCRERQNSGFNCIHFDLVTMSQEDPALVQNLLVTCLERCSEGPWGPLPLRRFSLGDTIGAFRHMARARHVGKVVVDWPSAPRQKEIRSGVSYLVTGGLGALGLGSQAQRVCFACILASFSVFRMSSFRCFFGVPHSLSTVPIR